jgi:hypothetical protein
MSSECRMLDDIARYPADERSPLLVLAAICRLTNHAHESTSRSSSNYEDVFTIVISYGLTYGFTRVSTAV